MPCRRPQREPHNSRRCRVYQRRTKRYINVSLEHFRHIFDVRVTWSPPEGVGCAELARDVKNLLGRCVSSDPSVQLSFQLIKKGLPDSCRCMESGLLEGLVDKITSEPRRLPGGYLKFARKVTKSLFPKGWDLPYDDNCSTTSPPLSATLEAGRKDGGCLGSSMSRDAFLHRVLSENSNLFPPPEYSASGSELSTGAGLCPGFPGALLVVQSAGKPRPLTKFSSEALLLRPLHKTMYGQLSKHKWLLRGDVRPGALERAGFSRGLGGVLVSGDYASATDNLPIEVAETCMAAMIGNSSRIPAGILDLSMRSLRPNLRFGDRVIKPTVGQMMGSYLSFPLLCLQNYIAFRWAFRHRRFPPPVLINGDDILFQAEESSFEDWIKSVTAVGLVVERTKTDVSAEFGTINSTLVTWVGSSLEVVPVLRFGMLRQPTTAHNLASSYEKFIGGQVGDRRFRAAWVFFKTFSGLIRRTGIAPDYLGFRGALAHRMARKFNLTKLACAELPDVPQPHDVSILDEDFCQVDAAGVDPELSLESARLMAAKKWAGGWRPSDYAQSVLRYCRRLSEATSFVAPLPSFEKFLAADPREFVFMSRGIGGGERPERSRKEIWKGYSRPIPRRHVRMIPYSIYEESVRVSLDTWDLFNIPPPYSLVDN